MLRPDKGEYRVTIVVDGKRVNTREYVKWYAMICRCYSESHMKRSPTYASCCVSEAFKSFQYFAKWCNNQTGFRQDFHLDKDLLVSGNKEYSEQTCCFLPREVNNFLCDRGNDRGMLPIGVTINRSVIKGKTYRYIRARVSKGGRHSENLGSFGSVELAFEAYKSRKEAYAKELAAKWKSQIDPRAYEALMNYQVEITD